MKPVRDDRFDRGGGESPPTRSPITLETDDEPVPGIRDDGTPDPEYAAALGLRPAAVGRRSVAFALDALVWLILAAPTTVGVLIAAPALLEGAPLDAVDPIAIVLVLVGLGLSSVFGLVQLVLHGLRGGHRRQGGDAAALRERRDLRASRLLARRPARPRDEAYEAALEGIEDATEGNVTDHWTDNLAGVVEVILTVLQVAGVILALAAPIIGGPLFAALAAIAGVLALLGTLYLAAKGRRNGGDIAWAVVGVLPFGRLGKLFQSGKRMTGLREFATAPVMDIVTPVRRIVAVRRLPTAEVIRQGGGMGNRAAQGLAQRLRTDFTLFSGAGPSGIVTRITQGSSRTWQNGMADAFASLTPHHQRLVSPHLGALQGVVARSEVSMPEMAINVVEFGIKRTNMVIGRSTDVMTALDERPVDAWSAELSR